MRTEKKIFLPVAGWAAKKIFTIAAPMELPPPFLLPFGAGPPMEDDVKFANDDWLLKTNPNRFVLYPIQHKDIWEMVSGLVGGWECVCV